MEKKTEWYLPNNDTATPEGPFSQEEILAKIQKHEITLDHFVWGTHFSQMRWMRIIELPEFALKLAKYPVCPLPKKRSRGNAQQMVKQFDFSQSQQKGEYGAENEYRRFPRVPFDCQVIIHNQKQFIKCLAVDISEKGLSIQTDESNLFKVGEEIVVTLLDTPYAGTFSMQATIMRSLDTPFKGYGIYFLTVNPSIKRKIAKYVLESLFGTSERIPA